MIIFGLIILGSELNIAQVISRISFMHSYIGRALLDIFVATICSSYLGSTGLNVISVVLTVSLFAVGLMYLCFHFTGVQLIIPPEILNPPEKKADANNSNNNNNLDNS